MRPNHLDHVNRRPISVLACARPPANPWLPSQGWHPTVLVGRAPWTLILQCYSRGSNRPLNLANSLPSISVQEAGADGFRE